MYIRISIWIRKPTLDQEAKTKKKKANALKVVNYFCKCCIRVSEKKEKPFQFWSQNSAILDFYLYIEFALNTNFLVFSAVIWQQLIITYIIRV